MYCHGRREFVLDLVTIGKDKEESLEGFVKCEGEKVGREEAYRSCRDLRKKVRDEMSYWVHWVGLVKGEVNYKWEKEYGIKIKIQWVMWYWVGWEMYESEVKVPE